MSLILDKNDKSYLNLDRERNEQNMNALDYNCGGYALGTFTWILLIMVKIQSLKPMKLTTK